MTRSWDETLALAQRGDEDAWVELIGSIAGPMVGFFRLRAAADPEDLAAEVFTRVATNIGSFSGDERGFRSWAFTIARRTLVDAYRRSSRRPVEAGIDPADAEVGGDRRWRGAGDAAAPSPEQHVVQAHADIEMLELLDHLTVDQRDVVILRVVGGFTIAETAEIVQKDPNAVKQLQHRGLAALRRVLEASSPAAPPPPKTRREQDFPIDP